MEQFVEKLIRELLNTNSIKIYFINPSYSNGNSSDATVKDYKIAKLNINDKVVEVIKGITSEFAFSISERRSIPVERLDKEDKDYVLTVPVCEIPFLEEYIEMIEKDEYTTFNAHDCDSFLGKLKFYMIQVTVEDKHYYFLKRYSKSKLITPRKVMLICKENTFDHIENDSIFTLDSNFDGFIFNGTIYIVNDTQFSFMTGYYEKEKKRADLILTDIENVGIIENFSGLREHCENRISYIKRLSKVDKHILNKLDYKKISELKDKRGTNFILNANTKKISFETVEQLNNVIDIILDNFVISELTEEQYRAVNKYSDKVVS